MAVWAGLVTRGEGFSQMKMRGKAFQEVHGLCRIMQDVVRWEAVSSVSG